MYGPLTPVTDVYRPDKHLEAVNVMGSDDSTHPAVSYLHNKTKEFYVGGNVQAIQPPNHFDYVPLRCESSSRSSLLLYLCSCRSLRPNISLCQTPPLSSEHTSTNSHGVMSSLSRPVTQCTEPTESSLSELLVNPAQTSSFTPSSVSPSQEMSTTTPVYELIRLSCLHTLKVWLTLLCCPLR
jgi:hypothetical protein